MATTYTLIESQTLSSSAASVTLGSGGTIPQTYTDLKVVVSGRNTAQDNSALISFNSSNSNFSSRVLYGDGSSPASLTSSNSTVYSIVVYSNYTANTFSSYEMYIPNYTSSSNKSFSIDSTTENNATSSIAVLSANLWSNTAAITSISFAANTGNFAQYSTFYLYGIKNS